MINGRIYEVKEHIAIVVCYSIRMKIATASGTCEEIEEK